MDLWTIFLRTIFIYFTILVTMRLMGKREVGKLSIFDLIVSFMIADLASIVIESTSDLIYVIIPVMTLVGLQIITAYLSLKSRRLRSWLDGEPTVLIRNGKIQDSNMRKCRYNIDDLLMQLREKDVKDVADVEFAILETTGKLSVFEKNKGEGLRPFRMPVPVILDGKVQDQALEEIGQNRFWLKQEIRKRGFKDFKEIFFASVNDHGDFFIDKKDPRRSDR